MLKRYGYLFMAGLMTITAVGCGLGGSGGDTGAAGTSGETSASAESASAASEGDTSSSDDPYAEATALTGGVLRVGMECAYAPFNWTQSSAEVDAEGWEAVPIYGTSDYAFGYDVMFAQLLADELGWELEVHKVDWTSIVLGLQSGDYDVIIAGMAAPDERRQTLDFAQPYYIRENVMVVQKDGPYANATGLSDFDGATITTQISTSWVDYLDQVPNANIATFPETTSEVIMQVAMGTVDCALLDYPTAYSGTLSNSDVTFISLDSDDTFVTPEGMSEDLCPGVNLGNTVLLDAISTAMDNMGWDESIMDQNMDLAIQVQPLSE